MSKKGFIFLMAFSLFFVLTKGLFPGQDDQPIKITRLADKLYKVTATAEYSVNLLASIGEDGLLLVDTGLPHSGENLLRALKELKAGPPKIIINTHQHIDHTGNNDKFGKGVTLIGHRKLRYRLQSGPLIIYEIPDYAVPSVSFDDTMNVFFNGEEIRLFAATGSHTDTDIGVYFTTSGVAYLGDLAYGMHVPSFDRLSGDILEYGNAVKKATTLARTLGLPVVADDSGLRVDALDGRPGVMSARYAGVHGDYEANNRKVLREMANVPAQKRTARFVTVVAFAKPDGLVFIAEGKVEGLIATEPRGANGFGYDPIFLLPERGVTMAQLTLAEKNAVSHRARAIEAFCEKLASYLQAQKV